MKFNLFYVSPKISFSFVFSFPQNYHQNTQTSGYCFIATWDFSNDFDDPPTTKHLHFQDTVTQKSFALTSPLFTPIGMSAKMLCGITVLKISKI